MLLLFAAAIFKRGTQKKKHFRQFVPPHTKTKSRKSAQTDGRIDGRTGEKFVRFCVLLPPLSSCRVSLMKNQPPAFDTGPPQTKQKSTETAAAATVAAPAAATATERQLLRLRLLRLLLLLLSLLHFSSNILCFSHFPIRVARAVKKKKRKTCIGKKTK